MSSLVIPIISVHTPKVAGSTFLEQLRSVFGDANLLLDYSDDPADISSRWNIDPESYSLDPIVSIAPYCVVHGHFHPGKYSKIDDAFRLTFLRHPVDNVISIFRFWSANPSEMWGSPLFRYFKENNLSVHRLAMLPAIRFLYSKTYFGGFDMRRFDFVGDYSEYPSELQRLGGRLGVTFDSALRLNVTPAIKEGVLNLAPADICSLSDILAEDILFYEQYAGK
nr:hypothetical protein [Pseudomonas alcaliphila]